MQSRITLAMRVSLVLFCAITFAGAQVLKNNAQCVDTDRWPIGQGTSAVPQQPNAELLSILNEISSANIKATVEKLVSFGTRHTLSDQKSTTRGIGAARDWIASQMREYAAASNGRMTVAVPSYVQTPGGRIPFNVTISNIVATIKGSKEPNRVYVVSGHYDSRVSDDMDYTSDAPGANDDASGVAVSLELARVFAKRSPAATIVLAAVAGEEQNLYGSTFLAQQMQASRVDIQAMFTNDIVGSSTADDGTKDPYSIRLFAQGPPTNETDSKREQRLSIGGENDSPTRNLARFVTEVANNAATNMTVRVIYRQDRFGRGGDHKPFQDKGYTAARFTEPHENFAHQHQDVRVQNGKQYGDLVEFCDFDFTARVARVNAAALWSLAQAPGIPTKVTISTGGLDNNSTLKWSDPSTVAGAVPVKNYEIVWRETNSPFWTDVIAVGKANTATIAVSKDNAIMGVRAVGEDGLKSPAVYPFPG